MRKSLNILEYSEEETIRDHQENIAREIKVLSWNIRNFLSFGLERHISRNITIFSERYFLFLKLIRFLPDFIQSWAWKDPFSHI